MQLTTIVIPTILALSTSAHAWVKDAEGNWVANIHFWEIDGKRVAEACKDKEIPAITAGKPCAYFADDAGTITRGYCTENDSNEVLCV